MKKKDMARKVSREMKNWYFKKGGRKLVKKGLEMAATKLITKI